MDAQETIDRYLALRAITVSQQSATASRVSPTTMMERARDIGIASPRGITLGAESELELLLDLVVHTAKPGRSRAIDRYKPDSATEDERRVLDALRKARFSIWVIEDVGGAGRVTVTDMLRDEEAELVDLGIAESMEPGMAIASRLCRPAGFAMTCGVVVPLTPDLLDEAEADCWPWLRGELDGAAADDPRFATAVYRNAILAGVMEAVTFREALAA